MKKLLVICGLTATGKTSLAIKLAKKFNGELVSADSRQVYKGMDIGTGKDHPKDAIIHLLDMVEPDEEFNVAKYYQLAWPVIKDIWKRGKLPILVGGTGFYIKAIIDGIESLGIEPDWRLRRELENLEIGELVKKLKKLDLERLQKMSQSDQQNPRRLIRAIEIAIASEQQTANSKQLSTERCKLDALFIGLKAPYEKLYQRIDERVEERVKKGVEKEIKKLLDKGYTWESSALGKTIAYKEWQSCFKGEASKDEVIQGWKFDEHAYARRQLTWFKKDRRIKWFDITELGFEPEVEKLVSSWYTSSDAQKS